MKPQEEAMNQEETTNIEDVYLEEGYEIDEIDMEPDYYTGYDDYDEDVAGMEDVDSHDYSFYDSVSVSDY